MKRNFALAIIISIITLGLASCSEGEPISLNGNINNFKNLNRNKNDEITYDNFFEINIIKDIQSLQPDLKFVIEQAKTQKGYLVFKGSDFSYPGITLVFISSGRKNTGGYYIEIKTIQEEKENNRLSIIVKETEPGPEDDVIQAITYPFILFTVEGEYNSFRITGVDGNEFDLINLKNTKSDIPETNNLINKDISRKIKADALIEKFIDALNMEESRTILDCLNPEMLGYYTIETVETTISDYKTYFKNTPIVKYNWIGNNSDTPNSYTYELISQSGNKLNINVIYNEDTMWIECDLLDYSYQSKHLLERFVYALKKESKILLSQILTVDDVDYPISNASKIIEKYKEHFDLETLKYEFVGIDSENQYFIYNIIGEKNRSPLEHPIKIIYKDKLVRLSDPWAPPY